MIPENIKKQVAEKVDAFLQELEGSVIERIIVGYKVAFCVTPNLEDEFDEDDIKETPVHLLYRLPHGGYVYLSRNPYILRVKHRPRMGASARFHETSFEEDFNDDVVGKPST